MKSRDLYNWLRTTTPRRRWSLMARKQSSIIWSSDVLNCHSHSRWNWGVDWLDIWSSLVTFSQWESTLVSVSVLSLVCLFFSQKVQSVLLNQLTTHELFLNSTDIFTGNYYYTGKGGKGWSDVYWLSSVKPFPPWTLLFSWKQDSHPGEDISWPPVLCLICIWSGDGVACMGCGSYFVKQLN